MKDHQGLHKRALCKGDLNPKPSKGSIAGHFVVVGGIPGVFSRFSWALDQLSGPGLRAGNFGQSYVGKKEETIYIYIYIYIYVNYIYVYIYIYITS